MTLNGIGDATCGDNPCTFWDYFNIVPSSECVAYQTCLTGEQVGGAVAASSAGFGSGLVGGAAGGMNLSGLALLAGIGVAAYFIFKR